MANSYSKKASPWPSHLFLPLDGKDPRTSLDKQSSYLALTLVQKLFLSSIWWLQLQFWPGTTIVTIMPALVYFTMTHQKYLIVDIHAFIDNLYMCFPKWTCPQTQGSHAVQKHLASSSFLVLASLKKKKSPLTGCFSLRLGAGCHVGRGLRRTATHRMREGRSWQLLGPTRWLRGRMGLPGLAVFDLQWGEKKKRATLKSHTDFSFIHIPPTLTPSTPHMKCTP